jgi:hypothetical protein
MDMMTMMLTLLAQCDREPETHCCNEGRDARPWTGYSRIRWERSLEEAKNRAAAEGKPILLYQLVGDLDKEGC